MRYIINGIEYNCCENCLLCEAEIVKRGHEWDLFPRVQKLYYPHGKDFILEDSGCMGCGQSVRAISKEDALAFMNLHPGGIKRSVYVMYFGEPEQA